MKKAEAVKIGLLLGAVAIIIGALNYVEPPGNLLVSSMALVLAGFALGFNWGARAVSN